MADGAPRDPLARQRRRPLRALLGAVRALLWHRLGLAFLAGGSDLAGRPVEDVHQTGQVRVIGLQRPGANGVDWSTGHQRPLAPQDRIYVLATGPACPGCSRAASPRGIDCRSFAFSLPYFSFFAG